MNSSKLSISNIQNLFLKKASILVKFYQKNLVLSHEISASVISSNILMKKPSSFGDGTDNTINQSIEQMIG